MDQIKSKQAIEAAGIVRARASALRPRIGLVLGTGLGGIADRCADSLVFSYRDLPGFPASQVSGHRSQLVIGYLESCPVAILQGRVHYYERGDARAMQAPLETLAHLGIEILLLTNSAGSLRTELGPGWPVAIADHINWSGRNPLIGDRSDQRFVNMVDAYDPGLRHALKAAARAEGFDLNEGVYAWYSGPSFETPAEIRMAQAMGADLVGMSTVPEVILARRLGLKVAALSMVTNYGAGLVSGEAISHDQTKAVAQEGSERMTRLIERFLTRPELEPRA